MKANRFSACAVMITVAMLLGACTIDSKGFYETREKGNTKTDAAVPDAEAGIPAGIGHYAISGEEIPVTDVAPVRIGQTEDKEAATGCTVIISENGMRAGLDIRCIRQQTETVSTQSPQAVSGQDRTLWAHWLQR